MYYICRSVGWDTLVISNLNLIESSELLLLLLLLLLLQADPVKMFVSSTPHKNDFFFNCDQP